jgi:ubiquinone/menaquinone biosynthesis C-methylase UbiE
MYSIEHHESGKVYTGEKFQLQIEEVLKEIGITGGQHILDCCCGKGTYTIAAAMLAGEEGLVYAIDQNHKKLDELRSRAEMSGVQNIEIVDKDVTTQIPLADGTVDVVLLYDIFWYFRPTERKTHHLLKEVRRVAKQNALISVYPTHVDTYTLQYFKNQMKDEGFFLVSEYSRQLVHEDRMERGTLLNFRREE